MLTTTKHYRPEIDGLRSIAVLVVVFFHMSLVFQLPTWFNQIVSGGYLGVDVFFVISGYLITGIILRELRKGTFSFSNFYNRRVRRIVPALLFVVLTTIPFALILMDPSELRNFGKSLTGIGLLASNYTFYKQLDYFADPAEYIPLLHTWSLAVEEQFYLIFPPLLLLLVRFRKRTFLVCLVSLLFLSLFLAEYSSHYFPEAGFYLPHTRIWQLGIGALLAWFEQEKAIGRSANPTIALFGVLVIIASCMIFDEYTRHPSLYTVLPVIGTALVLWFGGSNGVIGRILTSRPLVATGLLSYSLYLWHVPVLAFLSLRTLGSNFDWKIAFVVFVFFFILSYISWRFVETPCRQPLRTPAKKLFSILVFGWLLFLFTGILFNKSKGLPQRLSYPLALEQSFERPDKMRNGVLCIDQRSIDNLEKLESWDKHFCSLGVQDREGLEIDFLLLGDSHAYSSMDAFDQWAKDHGIRGAALAFSACPPLLGLDTARPNRVNAECQFRNEKVTRFLKENHVRRVFLVARWTYYTQYSSHQTSAEHVYSSNSLSSRQNLMAEAFEKTLQYYRDLGIKVVIVGQVPMQKHLARRIYATLHLPFMQEDHYESVEAYLRGASTTRQAHEEMMAYFHSLFSNYENRHQVTFLDPTETFCDFDVCLVGTPEKSFYFDDDHISRYGNSKLLPLLRSLRE